MNTNDKLEIKELLARAAFGLDQGDWDLLKSCFAEDAVLSIRIKNADLIGPFEGRDKIVQNSINIHEQQTDQRRHIISNTFFTSSNMVTTNVTITSVENDRTSLVCTGIYNDEVVSVNGEWMISKRQINLDSGF